METAIECGRETMLTNVKQQLQDFIDIYCADSEAPGGLADYLLYADFAERAVDAPRLTASEIKLLPEYERLTSICRIAKIRIEIADATVLLPAGEAKKTGSWIRFRLQFNRQ